MESDRDIQIGGLYSKKGDSRVFVFLDIFEKIRLIDLGDSFVYEKYIDSIIFKDSEKVKVDILPYHVAVETWGKLVTELNMLT